MAAAECWHAVSLPDSPVAFVQRHGGLINFLMVGFLQIVIAVLFFVILVSDSRVVTDQASKPKLSVRVDQHPSLRQPATA